MSLLFFLKPHYPVDGGYNQPAYIIDEREPEPVKPKKKRRKKKQEFEIESKNKVVLAKPAVESILNESFRQRVRKRKQKLSLLLKMMLDED